MAEDFSQLTHPSRIAEWRTLNSNFQERALLRASEYGLLQFKIKLFIGEKSRERS